MRGEVAAGWRREKGGGPPTSNLLEEGDPVIVDLYPVVGGYAVPV